MFFTHIFKSVFLEPNYCVKTELGVYEITQQESLKKELQIQKIPSILYQSTYLTAAYF